MLLIELNEFNRELLRNIAARHGLTHLQLVLGWSRASTSIVPRSGSVSVRTSTTRIRRGCSGTPNTTTDSGGSHR